MEGSSIVKLNVGGQIKEITRDTLEKSPLFESIFSDYPDLISEDRVPFVDRDPKRFDDVVLYLGWGILSETVESLYELDHYGILPPSADDDEATEDTTVIEEATQERVNALAEQIVTNSKPYVVSACGEPFVTTKERLMQIDYFRGIFDNGFKQKYRGTIEDPYRIDIPPGVFANILQHLRDKRLELSQVSIKVLEKFGQIQKKQEIVEVVSEQQPTMTISNTNGSGALMQLVAVGAQNAYLNHGDGDDKTLNTLWKSVYKRVTHAAVERISCKFVNNICTIPRQGELIYQCYLRWKFEANGVPFNVAALLKKDKKLLYKLVDYIDLEIGGQRIERLEGYQLYLLSLMDTTDQNKNGMLDVTDLTIHVPFPFCLDTGRALPLIALQHHKVRVILTPRALPNLNHLTATPELLVSYAFLENNERIRFAQVSHEYLLPLLHYSESFGPEKQSPHPNTSIFKARLNWNHPTRAIFVTLHTDDSIESLFNPLDDLLSYKFELNNHTRTEGDKLIAKLNKIDCKIARDNNVYVIPFALEPLNGHQPTMSVNMSRIDNATLTVVASSRVKFIRVWGNYWNVLRVMSGMGGLAYAT
jgi:hypothetical protein